MEQYLIDDHGVIECTEIAGKSIADIEGYFKDYGLEYAEPDCGQGYYQEDSDFIVFDGAIFYNVVLTFEIGSAKQNVGDRLYWVESIRSVSVSEIDKPEPSPVIHFSVTGSTKQRHFKPLQDLCTEHGFLMQHSRSEEKLNLIASSIPEQVNVKDLAFNKDQILFYNNNKCKFVSYLSEKVAVVIVEAYPNFEENPLWGTCQGCMVGDSDNKLSCTCDETAFVFDAIEEATEVTLIPLIVDVRMLFVKPLLAQKHESLTEEFNKAKALATKQTKEIMAYQAELISQNSKLMAEIEMNKKLLNLENGTTSS